VRTSRWTQACPSWRGDLAACLLGALNAQACAALQRHLSTCPACEAEYENLVPVVSWLALLTPSASAMITAAGLDPPQGHWCFGLGWWLGPLIR
jgi:anti-sigma factor RsiW